MSNIENTKDKWIKIINTAGKDGRIDPIIMFLNSEVGSRFFTSPSSHKTGYFGLAYNGGLAEYSLKILSTMVKINESLLGEDKFNLWPLVKVALFHNMGKIGNEFAPNYLPQDSDWHKKLGMMYKFDDNRPYMGFMNESLYLAQSNGVDLSYDEYQAILCSDINGEPSKACRGRETRLTILLRMAVEWVMCNIHEEHRNMGKK